MLLILVLLPFMDWMFSEIKNCQDFGMWKSSHVTDSIEKHNEKKLGTFTVSNLLAFNYEFNEG